MPIGMLSHVGRPTPGRQNKTRRSNGFFQSTPEGACSKTDRVVLRAAATINL
jgi:hypothetical protein